MRPALANAALLEAELAAILFQRGNADALDFQQLVQRAERAMLLAVGDDGSGLGRADAFQFAGERLRIRRVEFTTPTAAATEAGAAAGCDGDAA